MKLFLKSYFRYIPFALGIVFTLQSIVFTINCLDSKGNTLTAIILGVIGIPILTQSIMRINNPKDTGGEP